MVTTADIEVRVKNLTDAEFAKIAASVKGMERDLTSAAERVQHASAGLFDTLASGTRGPVEAAKSQIRSLADGELTRLASSFGLTTGQVAAAVAGLGGFVGATALLGHALVASAEQAVQVGASLHRMHLVTGESVEGLSGLRYASKILGEDLSTVTAAVFQMNRRMAESPPEFERGLRAINLDFADLRGLEPAAQLVRISDAMRATSDQTKVAEAAFGLFGRQGREMLPILLEELGDLVGESQRLGKTWTTDQAKQAEDIEHNVNRIHASFEGLRTQIGQALLPVVADLSKGLAGLVVQMGRVPSLKIDTGAWTPPGAPSPAPTNAPTAADRAALDAFSGYVKAGAALEVTLQHVGVSAAQARTHLGDLNGTLAAQKAATDFLAASHGALAPAVRTAALAIFGGGGNVTDALRLFKEQGLDPAEAALTQLHTAFQASKKATDEHAAAERARAKAVEELAHVNDQLSTAQRQRLASNEALGLSIAQIAAIEGLHESTIKKYLETQKEAKKDEEDRQKRVTAWIAAVEEANAHIADAQRKFLRQQADDEVRHVAAGQKLMADHYLELIRLEQDFQQRIAEVGLHGHNLEIYQLRQAYDAQRRLITAHYADLSAAQKAQADKDLALLDVWYRKQKDLLERVAHDWHQALGGIGDALGGVGQLLGGDTGALLDTLAGAAQLGASFNEAWKNADTTARKIDAMGTALAGFARNLSQTQTLGQALLSGASQGAAIGSSIMPGWGTAIGSGIGTLVAWATHESARVTEAMRQQFLSAYGGYDALRKLIVQAGLDTSTLATILFNTDVDSFKRQVADLGVVLDQYKARIQGLVSAGGGTSLLAKGFLQPFEGVAKQIKEVEAKQVDLLGKGETQAAASAAAQGAAYSSQLADMVAKGEAGFDHIGTYAVAVFGSILQQTGDLGQALTAVGDTLDALGQAEQQFGFKGSAAINELLGLRKVTKESEDLMMQLSGIGQIITGLGPTTVRQLGLVNAFGGDLARIYTDFKDRMVASGTEAGEAQKKALILIQPQLQQLWETTQNYRGELDESTKALLKQAEEAKLVGPDLKSPQAQMLDVMMSVRDVLKEIAAAFKGVEQAGVDAAAAVGNSWNAYGLHSGTGPDMGYIYGGASGIEADQDPFGTTSKRPPSYAGGSDGFHDYGAGTPAFLHGIEAVMRPEDLVQLVSHTGGGGGVPIEVRVLLDGETMARVLTPPIARRVRQMGILH